MITDVFLHNDSLFPSKYMLLEVISIHASGLPCKHKQKQGFLFSYVIQCFVTYHVGKSWTVLSFVMLYKIC